MRIIDIEQKIRIRFESHETLLQIVVVTFKLHVLILQILQCNVTNGTLNFYAQY